MELIKKYFPFFDQETLDKYDQLLPFYREWNEKINVISRKDIDNLYLHHVLHSLAIAKFISFAPNSKILDLGTGGGFPGIPLAIAFPEVQFVLTDSIGKKITVVNEVKVALGLSNVTAIHARAEELKAYKFDFVVTRAVAPADKLLFWSRKSISNKHKHIFPNGIIALKGGNLKEELNQLPKGEYTELTSLKTYFDEDYFDEKYVLYIQG